MTIGIDASNIRTGGGLALILNLVKNLIIQNNNSVNIILWSSKSTLSHFDQSQNLLLRNHPFLNKPVPYRIIWKIFILKEEIKKNKCDILLVPDGINLTNFHPFAAMALNMLVFENIERQRYGMSIQRLRLKLLNIVQTNTIKRADGIIFTSRYAQKLICNNLSIKNNHSTFIYYGKTNNFSASPKDQEKITNYSPSNPIRILYVSVINLYKHQWNVVEAAAGLYDQGIPVKLILIGTAYKKAYLKLKKVIKEYDPKGNIVEYLGYLNRDQLEKQYKNADIFVFASTCETNSFILTEAMSTGLPIASSNYESNFEVLENSAIYFDPLNVEDISAAIKKLISNTELRKELAEQSYKRSEEFSWEKSSDKTIEFLSKILKNNQVYSASRK